MKKNRNNLYTYQVKCGYAGVTVFVANKKTKRQLGTLKLKPNPTMGRFERYQLIAKFLKNFSITAEPFKAL